MGTSGGDDLGKKHGKYDMDRMGLFSEMSYMIGDKYQQPSDGLNNGIRDTKKAQMYPGIMKTKTGLQDAYFDQKFKRLFENDKWQPTPGPFNTKARDKSKGNVAPFVPPGDTKRHSTPGDYYGTFGPKLTTMSVAVKPMPKKPKWVPDFITAPTNTRGPGYTDICLNPFPEYKSSPYDVSQKKSETGKAKLAPPFITTAGPGEYFDKNPYFTEDPKPTYRVTYKQKFKGTPFLPPSTTKHFGNGFDRWPEHSTDRYVDPFRMGTDKKKDKKSDSKIFYPQTRNKSMYTTSTVQRKLKTAMNNTNWRAYDTVSFPVDKNGKQ